MAPAAANSTAAAEPAIADPKAKAGPTVVNRLDYKAPPYLIEQVLGVWGCMMGNGLTCNIAQSINQSISHTGQPQLCAQ